MEAGSDENNSPAADGLEKPKRLMKTPFQLQTLENAYNADAYPTEATRLELSKKLGLTDRQLKMWFCHRRLKDKKQGTPAGKTELLEPSKDDLMVAENGSDPGSRSRSELGFRSGSESSQFEEEGDDVTLVRRFYQPSPKRIVCRVIDRVEEQLGESLREDGPILGMEFDDLPPGAFGKPIGICTYSY